MARYVAAFEQDDVAAHAALLHEAAATPLVPHFGLTGGPNKNAAGPMRRPRTNGRCV